MDISFSRSATTRSLRSIPTYVCATPPIEIAAASGDAQFEVTRDHECTRSSDVIETKMEVEELEVPVLLIQDIPKMKYHEKPLHFMSEPGISQEDYEHMIFSGGLHPVGDETLTLKCPDGADGTGRVFEVKKSTLTRSPAFARFFQSDNFAPGCRMTLTFVTDPAICFKVAIQYLEEGSDRYTDSRLSLFLETHFKPVDRFIVLVRLYLTAMRMELAGLFNMCYKIIEDYEYEMTAGFCIVMASLIFAREATYDKRMKEWCLKYIRLYTLDLTQIRDWMSLVPRLDGELRHHWAKLLKNNKQVIFVVEKEKIGAMRDKILRDEMMNLSSVDYQHRISTQVQDRDQDMNVEEAILEVLAEQNESDQEWEDVESLLRNDAAEAMVSDIKMTPSRFSEDKANSVLGLPPSKKKIDAFVEWHNARLKPKEQGQEAKSDLDFFSGSLGSPEIAKARAVMGIDIQHGKLVGQKKRRFSRKVYSLLHS